MKNVIKGKAFVLGDNIDTDQIIPAEFLSYDPSIPAERKEFGRRALCGVPVAQSGLPKGKAPFVADGADGSTYAVIVAGRNFGCGSSREHAPLALAEAGCCAVIAESYARIFYRNSINGGYLAPMETPSRLVDEIRTGDEVELDVKGAKLTDRTTGKSYSLTPIGDAADILNAGGVFDYARKAGMLK